MPPDAPESDERNLEACCRGNPKALAQLLERHRDQLWRFLLRVTGNRADAEDMLQETFLRAVRGHEAFRGQGRVSTWLYAIALNLVRSRWRREARRPEPDEVARRLTPVRDEDPAELASRNETAEKVREAVNALPEPQRIALILSRYEGLPYEEIGRIEGCSVDAVKQRVRRGLKKLTEELKDLR